MILKFRLRDWCAQAPKVIEADAGWMMSIFLRDEQLIGAVALTKDAGESDSFILENSGNTGKSQQSSAELGYWIGKSHWRKGYAAEAAGALINHAFDRNAVSHIHASTALANQESQGLLLKLGFNKMGEKSRPTVTGEQRQSAIFQLNSKKWCRGQAAQLSSTP